MTTTVTLRLQRELYARLEIVAEVLRVPVVQVIRDAIDAFLDGPATGPPIRSERPHP